MGDSNNPEKTVEDIMKKLKNKYDFIFCLTSMQQFGQSADLYIRKEA